MKDKSAEYRVEQAHKLKLEMKRQRLRVLQALRDTYEESGIMHSPYLKELRARIHTCQCQLSAMGGL